MIALYVILGIVGALVLVVLILGMIAPKEVTVERTVVINKPPAEVFDQLRFLKQHETWSPWATRDPNMRSEYRGTDGEVGAVHFWSGNKQVGEGEQEIVKLTPNERIDTQLRFLKPWKATNDAFIKLKPEGTGTQVTWGFDSKMNFPMNVMMMFFSMEKAIGGDFEEGLSKMKTVMEA